MEKRHQFLKLTISAVVVVALVLLLAGLFGKDRAYRKPGPYTRDDITYLQVPAPEASSKDGTVNAKDWSAVYPEIAVSMGNTKNNVIILDYLEQDPYLVNIYDGFPFSVQYGGARGHEYTLEDVNETQRKHPLANCLTCKTPNFAKLVQDEDVGVYTREFGEVFPLMEENVSCYSCHGNNAGNGGERVVTHTYVLKALGDNVSTIDPSTLACGQCHIEYYFTPQDKETMMPYDSVSAMTPEAILEYYDNLVMPDGSVGFSDWIQESTGAHLLKAQHPELETFLSGPHAGALNCADCHMPIVKSENGTVYHSHDLVSPLDSRELLDSCVRCHGDTDMTSYVRQIQESVTKRENEVGNKLSDFKDALAAAVAEGSRSESELDTLRKLYREAQWFFDFCYVENAEGAHNSSLANRCLDTAEAKIALAMDLLGS